MVVVTALIHEKLGKSKWKMRNIWLDDYIFTYGMKETSFVLQLVTKYYNHQWNLRDGTDPASKNS